MRAAVYDYAPDKFLFHELQRDFFRVENVLSVNGELYCLRRMPLTIPSIHNLSFDHRFVQYMLSLSSQSGLIIWGGATGSGKTTSISSLLAEYLNLEGGFAYTIEDPAEMPLEGEYQSFNGSIGFCKQTEVQMITGVIL